MQMPLLLEERIPEDRRLDERVVDFLFELLFSGCRFLRAAKVLEWLKAAHRFHKDKLLVSLTIPQRSEILMVDRIEYRDGADSCFGYYSLRRLFEPEWLKGHNGIMPGALICELALQTGLALIVLRHNLLLPVIGEDFFLVEIKSRFLNAVKRGGLLRAEVKLLNPSPLRKGKNVHNFSFKVFLLEGEEDDSSVLVADGSYRALSFGARRR